jgi:hypothetical protein
MARVALSPAGVAVTLLAVSVVASLVVVAIEPKPPLTAKLHGPWGEISKEFDRRVKMKFPVGSSESRMIFELGQENFTILDKSSTQQEREATRDEYNFVCDQAAYVYWRKDRQDRLTQVRGEYREQGCL